jgi:chemotaxis protein CheX
MDVNFFKPFVEGTLNTLKVQCNVEAKPGKPFIRRESAKLNIEIAAIIGLASGTFSGTIALCFTKQAFLSLMNSMLSENYTEITSELQDGAGELLNIIFGHAKRVLNTQGYEIQKAIPSIIRGQNLEAKHLTTNPIIVLPFITEQGEFYIEICAETASMK